MPSIGTWDDVGDAMGQMDAHDAFMQYIDQFNSSLSASVAVEGGYSFSGQAAQNIWSGVLEAYNTPHNDGYWSFTVGQQNGTIGYWQRGQDYTYNDPKHQLAGVGVTMEFVDIAKTKLVYWKDNPTTWMSPQVTNSTCQFTSMEYLNHEYGGKINEGD